MNVSKVFTGALVLQQIQHSNLEQGYFGRDDYLKKETSWKALIDGMHEDHKKQYGGGSGGELEPKNGNPPKMAAFASSSRMIYTLSTKDSPISKIKFEEKLPTTIGGVANMDGYRENDGEYVFVEAKCREPYDHHTKQTVKQAYKNLYEYLEKKHTQVFSCVMEDVEKNNMRVVFFCKEEVVAHFDIKQMICHLLGVATKFLKPLDKKGTLWPEFKKLLFLYLLYNPSELPLSGAEKETVMRIYNNTCEVANNYQFEKIFAYIVDYLVSLQKAKNKPVPDKAYVDKLKAAFDFKLCSQDDYRTYF